MIGHGLWLGDEVVVSTAPLLQGGEREGTRAGPRMTEAQTAGLRDDGQGVAEVLAAVAVSALRCPSDFRLPLHRTSGLISGRATSRRSIGRSVTLSQFSTDPSLNEIVPGEGGLVGLDPLSGRGVQSGRLLRLDTALVTSGGSVNGIFLQLGFLQAVSASELWAAVGWLYGTSAGALSGWAAALDAVDEHERFLMEMQPADVFAAHDLWRTPFVGLHRYTLPETVAERLGDPIELARRLKAGPRELTVVTTDIGLSPGSAASDDPFERAFSSRREEPETFVAALFASAAISTFVLPTPDRRRTSMRTAAGCGTFRSPTPTANRECNGSWAVAYRAPASGFAGRGLQSLHKRISRFDRPQGRARSHDRVARGNRAARARRADAPGGHDRAAQSHRRLPKQRARGAAGRRARPLPPRTQRRPGACARRSSPRRAAAAAPSSLASLDEAFASADFPFTRSRVVPRLVVDVATPPGYSSTSPAARDME